MSNWQCPDCDSFNPETVDDCLTCGAHRTGNRETVDGTPEAYQLECPNCEGNNPPTRRRCQWCGHELPEAALPEDTAPEVPIDGLPGPGAPARGERAPAPGGRRPQPAAASASASASVSPSAPAPRPSSAFPRDSAGAFMPVSTEETELAATKRKPHTDAARPCHFCGTMMEPDDWILVAGPKLVCRVCYHEEVRSKDKSSRDEGGEGDQRGDDHDEGDQRGDDHDEGGKGLPGASGEDGGESGKGTGERGPSMNWKAGAVYLVPGALCLAGGAAVTVVWSFTWGFTPLAAGVLLAVLGVTKASPK